MILKIGLLLDSWVLPKWQKEIITFINSQPSFTIRLVVINSSDPKRASGGLMYRAFRKLDRVIFPSVHDCFVRVNIKDALKDTPELKVTPLSLKFTDEIAPSDLEIIKNYEIDVFVRFGFRILTGDILRSARFGVWSLHHGDNSINRGGPPAFWEVVNNEPVTGVTLQVLSEKLDGGIAIGKSFIKTDRTSFNRNQNALYWAGIELFCSSLQRLQKERKTPSEQTTLGFYSSPLYKNPTNIKALIVFARFWIRRLSEVIINFFNGPQWSLYYKSKDASLETYLFRYKRLATPRGRDWADPFVMLKDDEYFVFFEEFINSTRKGHISLLRFDIKGNLKTSSATKILEENHHLSYPFIFEHENTCYMIPESAQDGSVWLYKCERFPERWQKFRQLLFDVAFYDPTLLYFNNIWYLFGTQKPLAGNSPDQYLYIYWSDDLFSSSWTSHPQNPITRDVRGARPAGRIFTMNDSLVRPSQLGAPKYGYGVRFQRIITLSPNEYKEEPLDEILPLWEKKLLATHTFNFVDGFMLVDTQR